MTDCVISVWHCTMPSKVAIGACTLTALAVTSTVLLAVTLTCPPTFITSSQPLLCLSVTLCAASSSTSLWPLCISSVTLDAPSVSSNSSNVPERVLSTRLLFAASALCGNASRPFQTAPTM